MKKTFKQLTVGDPIYVCKSSKVEYEIIFVSKVESEHYYGGGYFDRKDIFAFEKDNFYYFTHKPDALRFCKAQTVKYINKLINKVKNDIKTIVEFKKTNYENLNVNWTETEINKLENEINNH